MKNKGLIIALLALAVLVAGYFVWQGGANDEVSNKEVIKIGVIVPLSGESAFWGQNIKDGIELAKDKINKNGGIKGRQIITIYEDTKGEPKTATNAVNKLINTDDISYIIGDVISSNILAIAPIVEKNTVPLIGFGESAEITNAGDYIFRNWNSASSDAAITGKFAAENSKTIILLSRNDAFGLSAKTIFKKVVNGKLKIIDDIQFDTESNDFRSIISLIKNKSYDAIYFAGFHKEAMEFLSQYIEMGGQPVDIYGVSSWEEQTLIEFIEQNYPGTVYYGYPKPPDSTLAEVIEFRSLFKQTYGKSPEILNDNGYDAVMMYKKAIELVGSFEQEKVKDGLYLLDDFKGATGEFSIDDNGDVQKPFGLKRINSKGVKWIQ